MVLCPLEVHAVAYQREMRRMREEQAFVRRLVVASGLTTVVFGAYMASQTLKGAEIWEKFIHGAKECQRKVVKHLPWQRLEAIKLN